MDMKVLKKGKKLFNNKKKSIQISVLLLIIALNSAWCCNSFLLKENISRVHQKDFGNIFFTTGQEIPEGATVRKTYEKLGVTECEITDEKTFAENYQFYKERIFFPVKNTYLKPLLLSAKYQLGFFLKENEQYLSDPNTTIAIIDTGIDPTLECYQNTTILHWKDFVGENLTEPNDEYLQPTDYNGHGSAVGSIIAGNSVSNGSVSFEKEIYEGSLKFISYIEGTFNEKGAITVSWDDSNLISVGLYDLSSEQIVQESVKYDNGSFTWQFSYHDYKNIVCFVANYGGSGKTTVQGEVQFESLAKFKGLIPNARLVVLKAIDDYGFGNTTTLLEALDYLLTIKEEYNIKIVNLSVGFDESIELVDDAINRLAEEGIVVVIAAGNGGTSGTVNSPGTSEYAITVGSVNSQFGVAYYSSHGCDCPLREMKPDVLAPGGEIANDFRPLILAQANTNNMFINREGTSFSTAFITGAVYNQICNKEWSYTLQEVLDTKFQILQSTVQSFSNDFNGDNDYISQTPEEGIWYKDRIEGWGTYVESTYVDTYAIDPFTVYSSDVELSYTNDSLPRNLVYRLHTPNLQDTKFRLFINSSELVNIRFIIKSDRYGNPVNSWGVADICVSGVFFVDGPNTTYYITISPSQKETLQVHLEFTYIVDADATVVFPYSKNYYNTTEVTGNIYPNEYSTVGNVSIDGEEISFSNNTFYMNDVTEGKHFLVYEVSNSNYHETKTEPFYVDLTLPQVVFEGINNDTHITYDTEISVEIFEITSFSVKMSIDSIIISIEEYDNSYPFNVSKSWWIDYSDLTEGEHTLIIEIKDFFNRTSVVSVTFFKLGGNEETTTSTSVLTTPITTTTTPLNSPIAFLEFIITLLGGCIVYNFIIKKWRKRK